MPTLYILADPNGAGKPTYYETAEGFINFNLPFINVDLITRSLPGMYTPENFAKADVLAREKIASHMLLWAAPLSYSSTNFCFSILSVCQSHSDFANPISRTNQNS